MTGFYSVPDEIMTNNCPDAIQSFELALIAKHTNIAPTRILPLFSYNDSAEYILIEYDNSYEIFHRFSGKLLEKNLDGISLYSQNESKKYYFGPVNYAEKLSKGIVNISTGKVISEQDLKQIKNNFQRIEKTIKSTSPFNDFNSFETEHNNIQFDFYDSSFANDETINSTRENKTPTSSTFDIIYDNIHLSSFTKVPHPEIFYNTCYHYYDFGTNYDGSCSIIALQILLHYWDAIYDVGIKPNRHLGSQVTDFWKYTCQGKTIMDVNGITQSLTINDNESYGNAFKKYLLALSNASSLGISTFSYNSYSHTCTLHPFCYAQDEDHHYFSVDHYTHQCQCGYTASHNWESTDEFENVPSQNIACSDCAVFCSHSYSPLSGTQHQCIYCNHIENHSLVELPRKFICWRCGYVQPKH